MQQQQNFAHSGEALLVSTGHRTLLFAMLIKDVTLLLLFSTLHVA